MSSSVTENKSLHIAASCWRFIDIRIRIEYIKNKKEKYFLYKLKPSTKLRSVVYYNKMFPPLTPIYLLTAIGLTPGGGSTVHIYTQTIH